MGEFFKKYAKNVLKKSKKLKNYTVVKIYGKRFNLKNLNKLLTIYG